MEQLILFALQHLRDRNACPAAYYLGDVVLGNLLTHHGLSALRGLQLLLDVLYVVFQLFQPRVADLSDTLVVALTLGTVGLILEVFHLLLVLLNLVHQGTFAFPFCTEAVLLFPEFGNLLVELCDLLGVVFPLDGLTLNLELFQPAGYLVQFLGYRIALHAQLGSCLVHQVDGLVGQETVGDVTL